MAPPIRAMLVALAIVGLTALVLLGVVLGIDNHAPVALRFLTAQTPALAVFWWLYAAFLVGAVVGFALCSLGFVRGKLHERQLKSALAQRDREIARLRQQEGA